MPIRIFRLHQAVHYGYSRPAGVYDDLSPADCAALAAYGSLESSQETPKESDAEVPTDGPDDSLERPENPQPVESPAVNPLACPQGCRDGKPFKSTSALQSHRAKEKH